MEALACGILIVATAVGGIPEQVQDGITGFLTPPRDAEAIAARINIEGQAKKYIDWFE